MNKNFKTTGSWIMALISVLLFSCEPDPVPKGGGNDYHEIQVDPGVSNIISLEGNWAAVSAVLADNEGTRDLSDYFNGFELTIVPDASLCGINGDVSWRAVKDWENYSTIFENFKDKNTMLFDIMSASAGESGSMTVMIEKRYPGFSFIPEQWNTGNYLITFQYQKALSQP
jgi:hypothetical protein